VSRYADAMVLLRGERALPTLTLCVPPAIERVHVACVLAQALLSGGSVHVRAIHHAAELVRPLLMDVAPCTLDDRARQLRRAIALRDAVTALPREQHTPVLVAVIRTLLDDSPEVALPLDRAVRDAARAHGHEVTAQHEAEAARIVGGGM
jgi:hypothetical protein